MTKTRTEKHMEIEVGGDKSQDEINDSESDDNLNSVNDDYRYTW